LELASGSRTHLTYDADTNELRPHWSSDGRQIAYTQTTGTTFERIGSDNTIHFIATDGGGETRAPIEGGYLTLDRDWKQMAFVRNGEKTAQDIYYLLLDGTSDPTPLIAGPGVEEQPSMSPDGQWLAYTSDESGVQQIYLTRLPDAQGKWQVSSGHGMFPTWGPDGKRIYYVGDEVQVLEVELATEPRVMLSRPRPVLDGTRLGVNPYQGFIPLVDALMVVRADNAAGASTIGVIENWMAEFQGRP